MDIIIELLIGIITYVGIVIISFGLVVFFIFFVFSDERIIIKIVHWIKDRIKKDKIYKKQIIDWIKKNKI